MYMDGLNTDVKTPVFILSAAGLIMMLALIFSRKAHNVLKTTVDLSRSEGADERFRPNTISKLMVRASVYVGQGLSYLLPRRIREHIEGRFDRRTSRTSNVGMCRHLTWCALRSMWWYRPSSSRWERTVPCL